MKKILLFLILLHLYVPNVLGNELDSLKNLLVSNEHDSVKANAYIQVAWKILYDQPELAMQYARKSLALSVINIDSSIIILAYNTLGLFHDIHGNYDSALYFHQISLDLAIATNDLEGQSKSHNNMGLVYDRQSDFQLALEFYQKSLDLKLELGGFDGLATSYTNIGNIYYSLSNYPYALQQHFKALEIDEQLNDSVGMATDYNNIGNVYSDQLDDSLALYYYLKAHHIYESADDLSGMAVTYVNLANVYQVFNQFELAFTYYQKAIVIDQTINDQYGLAMDYLTFANIWVSMYEIAQKPDSSSTHFLWIQEQNQNNTPLLDSAIYFYELSLDLHKSLSNEHGISAAYQGLGEILLTQGSLKKAIYYFDLSLILSQELADLSGKSESHFGLFKSYQKQEKYALALAHHISYTALRDSVFGEDKNKAIHQIEARRALDLAEVEAAEQKRLHEAELAILETAIKRRDLLQYSGIMLFIVVFFIGLVFSTSFNIPISVAEGGVFFTFLLLFEFLLVLSDPYVDQYTGGAPLYKLIINAGLAVLIFPLHSLAESKLKKRLFTLNNLQ